MTYSEKLKDPRWQKKRLEILKRDRWSCFYCWDTKSTLHVHHQIYIGKDPWDTPEYGLITLCEDCHDIEHLPLTELEKVLVNSLKNRHLGDFEMVKRINRVVKGHYNG